MPPHSSRYLKLTQAEWTALERRNTAAHKVMRKHPDMSAGERIDLLAAVIGLYEDERLDWPPRSRRAA